VALTKRGNVWWIDFHFAGERIQESTHSSRKTIAREYEDNKRKALEAALAGIPAENPKQRIRSVSDVCKTYRENFSGRPKTVAWVKDRLKPVEAELGPVRLIDLNEDRIRAYMKTRQRKHLSGRSINIEVSLLSRAIGKKWGILWPNLSRLDENKDVGRALSVDEQKRILTAALSCRFPTVGTFLRILLLTAMRCGELSSLTWGQVDFENQTIRVGKAKTDAGTGRLIPINDELLRVLEGHRTWCSDRFGAVQPSWFVFPGGTGGPVDPTCQMLSIKKVWGTVRTNANVSARLHDLRHTAITNLAESQASDSTIMAIVGHMSRGMLEHYSHIRTAAKRVAVNAMTPPWIWSLQFPLQSAKIDASRRPIS